ncbi:MAG: hypothetical protein GXX86_01360 [Propionibacterium sp.]|nr:hypothetical protein [Propionibacterium sp.]
MSNTTPVVCVGSAAGDRRRAFDRSVTDRPVRWVTWPDVLDGAVDWAELLADQPVLRLDSPSDDPATDARLLHLGGDTPGPVGTSRLLRHDRWHAGLAIALSRLDEQLRDAPAHRRLQPSATLLAVFNKLATAEVLNRAGVPTPTTEYATTVPDALEVLAGRAQSFVKIRHGSSAAGMIAVRRHGDRWLAHSTYDPATGANVTRPVTLHGREALTEALTPLVRQGVVIQPWLPKVTAGGGTVDFRVVVIDRRARHVLPRVVSGTPFTNLHLGARRGDPEAIRAQLGADTWHDLLATAEHAVAAFDPPALYAGVDVLVRAGSLRPYVLEVNAFGDFHEGIEVDGQDTYRAEMAACDALRVAA